MGYYTGYPIGYQNRDIHIVGQPLLSFFLQLLTIGFRDILCYRDIPETQDILFDILLDILFDFTLDVPLSN